MTYLHTKYSSGGYSLVEVLVAISILLIAIIGPMTIAVKGIQSARYSKEQTTAVFLAQEGIEAFVAVRNEAMIDAIHNGTLPSGWSWVNDPQLSACFASEGCNFDVEDLALTSNQTVLSAIAPVEACASNSCALYLNTTNGRSRYTVTGGGSAVATPFTRVVKLVKDSTNDGVFITSEVSWSSGLFSSGPRSVTLESAVYRLYE